MPTRSLIRKLVAIACFVLIAGTVWAALSDLDQKRIDVAKDTRVKEHERAKQAYDKATQAADDKLRRVYEQLIKTYEARGDKDAAEALRQDMNETIGEAAEADEPKVLGHIELIQAIGDTVQTADQAKADARRLAASRYMLVYFSAHWCGPCRAFTPKLVDYFNTRRQGNNFNVVFVSHDRSEAEMFSYMTEAKMPWVTVPFDQVGPSGLKAKYGGRGIPNLVLLDAKGNVISGSYQGDQYVGPQKVLDDLTQLLNRT